MSNKVALVTGGARGIGLGISKQLAKEGWDVVCCGTRRKADCQDALNQILGAAKEAGKEISAKSTHWLTTPALERRFAQTFWKWRKRISNG